MKITMLKTGDTFNPNHSILHKLRTHPDNQTKRNWYVVNYALRQREAFRDLWMANMKRIGCEIKFFKRFEMTGKIENETESLQMIINKWCTTSNKVVEYVTPHLEGLNIHVAGTIIKASSFKEKCDKPSSFVTPADIDRETYSIFYLSSQNIETNPGFKLIEFSRDKFPKFKDTFEISGNILDKINEQLTNFNISTKDGTTQKKVSTLQEKSNLLHKLSNDRFHNMKNYHNSPSFPYLQYEENTFLSTSSHEGRGITERNIDVLAEHQIYNKLHEMGVAITGYKVMNSTDRETAILIAAGFTGMLKHWWDNYCNDETNHLIYNATTTETVVKTEGTTEITSQVTREDACATLLYHIGKHFIGEPKLFQDRSLQILNNLSCPSLDHFIRYKHAFLSKVMIRPDCNLDFWKECFISGLPPLFADKVRTKIQYR
ncbi:hypothetical protein KY285_004811 [Solanum tuberosum]|nr:hypothetical protein KY289_005242 [Solanum tuberosum]KAH0751663.1 hypothetical protein KY285_004811 [Solanum tuberosum]